MKSTAKKRADEKARRRLCEARNEERAARQDVRRTERDGLRITRAHTRALERLERARSGCKTAKGKGCKNKLCSRRECLARPQVRELARQLQATQAAHRKALVRHAGAAKALEAAGQQKVAPLGEPPPPRRRDGGPRRASCGTVCHIQVRDGICGGQAAVLLPSAQGSPREVPTRYCLMEADQLITSHDPVSFAVDPRYPAGTQERRYDRDRAEQGKVVSIGQNRGPS